MIATIEGSHIALPGLASAHSHAFQRALRGRTHRARGSFWSWRGLMYELAAKVTPEDVYDLSRFAFVELACSGVTAVGEFHYLHHQPDGTPYADRNELADAVTRAALDAGLRITLLRVLYRRAGFGRTVEGAQRRFVDADVDRALADIDAYRARWKHEPRVRAGVAPHSVRAVPIEWIEAAARFARERELPFHMHVAEQRREVQECLAEHGLRPVELLADRGVLDERFVAVHATHLAEHEARALGAAPSFVCICRTTERDLGDGLPPLAPLLASGARLTFGVDSHASSDPFEEARAAELDERSRTERRCAAADGETLLAAATREGYAAIGAAGLEREDRVLLDRGRPELAGAPEGALLDDAVVFATGARSVDVVEVAGVRIVERGRHARQDEAREAYEAALRRLL
ncbi:MAG TPA: formimidoylglutamate deiminase [Sandaracinaceae bacterium]